MYSHKKTVDAVQTNLSGCVLPPLEASLGMWDWEECISGWKRLSHDRTHFLSKDCQVPAGSWVSSQNKEGIALHKQSLMRKILWAAFIVMHHDICCMYIKPELFLASACHQIKERSALHFFSLSLDMFRHLQANSVKCAGRTWPSR